MASPPATSTRNGTRNSRCRRGHCLFYFLGAYELPGPVPEPRREGVILALGRYQAVVEAVRVRRGLGARLSGEVGAGRDVVGRGHVGEALAADIDRHREAGESREERERRRAEPVVLAWCSEEARGRDEAGVE